MLSELCKGSTGSFTVNRCVRCRSDRPSPTAPALYEKLTGLNQIYTLPLQNIAKRFKVFALASERA